MLITEWFFIECENLNIRGFKIDTVLCVCKLNSKKYTFILNNIFNNWIYLLSFNNKFLTDKNANMPPWH